MAPAEIDTVQIGGVAVAEFEYPGVAVENLGVLAIELAVDFREPVGGDQAIAEPLPFFLVAGDALGLPDGHVLHGDEAVDAHVERVPHRSHTSLRLAAPASNARSRTPGHRFIVSVVRSRASSTASEPKSRLAL